MISAFTTINKNLTSVLVHKYFMPFGLYKMIQGREVVTCDFTLLKSNRLQTVMRTLDLRNRNTTVPMDSDNPLLRKATLDMGSYRTPAVGCTHKHLLQLLLHRQSKMSTEARDEAIWQNACLACGPVPHVTS